MNSISIYFILYAMIIFSTGTWLNSFSIAAEDSELYTVESHMHGHHLVINVTCLETSDEESVNSTSKVRRSLSPYDTHKHDVPSSGLNVGDGRLLNINEHDPSKGSTKKHLLKPLVAKEESRYNNQSENDGTSSSDKGSETINSKQVPDHTTGQAVLAVDCRVLEVSSNMLNSSFHKLKIKSTGVLQLSPHWAENSPDLTRLKIKSEGGLEFPQDCSWVPPKTHSLDLSYTPLYNFTLSNCEAPLKRLQLQGTSLQNLSVCVESLEELDASWNMLSREELSQHCPQMTSNVKQLKMQNNELTSWDFCNWSQLVHVDLQNNNIKEIQFTKCHPFSLFHLNLAHNEMVNPPQKWPSKLSFISLSHNRLKELTHFNRGIQEVVLSHNFIKTIGKGVFRSASTLLSLDLSHNQLTVIYGHDFHGLHALRYLDLSHNIITHIRHEALLPLRQMQELRIQSNSLHQLDTRLMAQLPKKLFHFSVSDNPWRCSCHLLASLSKASTSRCRPNCREMPELTCREGKKDVSAQDVLRQCIEAMQETETLQPVFLMPSIQESDEDTSEEQKTGTDGGFKYYALIPVFVLFLAIPVLGFGIRKVYLNRKRILRRCNCVSSGPSDAGSANARWSTQYMEQDTDSETEF